jgi:hypothetical protein
VALEVVGDDGTARMVSVVGGDADGAAPPTRAGRAGSPRRDSDGRTIAVADEDAAGVVVRDLQSWWAGEPGEPTGSAGTRGGGSGRGDRRRRTRLAVVYAEGDADPDAHRRPPSRRSLGDRRVDHARERRPADDRLAE